MTLPKPAPSYYEYRKGEPDFDPDTVPALESTTIIRNTGAIKEALRDRQRDEHQEAA